MLKKTENQVLYRRKMKLSKLTLGFLIAAIVEFCLLWLWVKYSQGPQPEHNIEVYIAYHKPSKLYEGDILVPIQAGRALHLGKNKRFFSHMIGDDTGDNISLKNDKYSELTALYWIWKNSKADYVGLMHYRRFLNLYNTRQNEKFENLGITRENIEAIMKDADVVTARYRGFNVGRNVYEHYLLNHYAEDFYVVIRYIMKKYPELTEELYRFLHKKSYMPYNIFVARKEVIDEYCEWLFDILFAVEEDMNFPHGEYDFSIKKSEVSYDYQKRAPGFIAERLFTFWLEINKDKYRNKQYPTVYFERNWTEEYDK